MSKITLDEMRRWPITVDVPKAAQALGISRSHAYAMADQGEFPLPGHPDRQALRRAHGWTDRVARRRPDADSGGQLRPLSAAGEESRAMTQRNDPRCGSPGAAGQSDDLGDHGQFSTADRQPPSDLDEYVKNVLADRPGILAVGFGVGPHWDGNGKYRHSGFEERYYTLPVDLSRLRRDVEKVSPQGVDVYACPALRCTRSRRKGTAKQPLTGLWADLDGTTDDALLAELKPFIVDSGSEGHLHIYVPLSEPVGLDRWQQLQTALRDRLNGDAKIADNDLLRLPGTWNHKTEPPNPVRCQHG